MPEQAVSDRRRTLCSVLLEIILGLWYAY